MEKLVNMKFVLLNLWILVFTQPDQSNAQCVCSCSSMAPKEDTCEGTKEHNPPPQNAENKTCQCQHQTEILYLIRDLQDSVSMLKDHLSSLSESVEDLKDSIPDRVQQNLNVTWTVSPGRDDPKTPYPADIIWEGVHKTHPRDCKEILDAGDSHGDGIYRIYNEGQDEFNNVKCSMDCDGGGWLEVMRRFDGSVNFNRTWHDYVNGFGDLKGEFWMGLDFIHNVTMLYQNVILRIDLITDDDDYKYAQYKNFRMQGSSTNYRLAAGSYSGSAGTGLSGGNNRMFSTFDHDNDDVSTKNCASSVGGGWWFYPSSTCGYTWPTAVIDDDLIRGHSGGISYGSAINVYILYKEVTMKMKPAFEHP